MVVHSIKVDGKPYGYDPATHDAVEYLNKWVYRVWGLGIEAVGFKLFADYVQGPGSQRLFARLHEEQPEIRYLHIKRQNYFEVLISKTMAEMTGEWQKNAENSKRLTQAASPRISIDLTKAKRFFTQVRDVDKFYESFFSDRQLLTVEYSDLNDSLQPTMGRVFDFLKLTRHTVSPKLEKQETKSPRQRVENFAELDSHFSGSEFSKFFK